jgi:phosphomannomutase/phosphoglucomutase
MNPRVFREYDIRGNADRDLDDAFVEDLGRAMGTHLHWAGARRITLGRDCRVHSPRLHAALRAGILSTGTDVIDVGVVATPVLYYSVFHFDADGGVQITGSHNPPEDNGFKILRGKSTIHGQEIQELRKLVEKRDFFAAPATEGGKRSEANAARGSAEPEARPPGKIEDRDISGPYLEMARSRI